LPACDFFSICEHLPFWRQITFQIFRFVCCFPIALALREPPGFSGIQGVLAKDLIYKSFASLTIASFRPSARAPRAGEIQFSRACILVFCFILSKLFPHHPLDL